MFAEGIFGGLFDLDGDGKLDLFEQGLEFMAISELMEEEETDSDFNDLDDDLDFFLLFCGFCSFIFLLLNLFCNS